MRSVFPDAMNLSMRSSVIRSISDTNWAIRAGRKAGVTKLRNLECAGGSVVTIQSPINFKTESDCVEAVTDFPIIGRTRSDEIAGWKNNSETSS